MANGYYDPKEEYYKRLKRLARNYDPDGRLADEDRQWIKDYEETESLNNMGGS